MYTQENWCTDELTEIVAALMRPIKKNQKNLRMEKRSEHKILTITIMVLQLTPAKKVKTNFL